MTEMEELRALRAFKEYFDDLYGQGLEVANWHQNGDTEPFDSFYDDAFCEYEKAGMPREASEIADDMMSAGLYKEYCERFKEGIDDITLADTEALYENDKRAKVKNFNEYVSEYGYSNGLKPYTLEEYREKQYSFDILVEEIEEFMYERGEYDFQPDDTIRWITSADRDDTVNAIRDSLKNDPAPLLNYFADERDTMFEEDELMEAAADLRNRIKAISKNPAKNSVKREQTER